jgi:hypothetical protein
MVKKAKKKPVRKAPAKAAKKTVKKPTRTTRASAAKKAPAKSAKVKAKSKTRASKAAADEDEEEPAPAKKGFPARKKGTKAKPKLPRMSSAQKKKLMTFKAPSDLKPHFLVVMTQTQKDGLFSHLAAHRYRGRPDNPKAKFADLAEYDPNTLTAIAMRLGGTSYVTNMQRRLPANSSFRILLRVGANRATGAIRVGFKEIKMKGEGGKVKTLDKKDPIYRRIRKAARVLPAAFTKALPFPKLSKRKAKDDEGDE